MPEISKRLQVTSSYAFDEINKKVAVLEEKGVDVIDLGVGDPTTPTPDFVMDAMYAGAKKHAKTGYPAYAGSPEYRKACADYMKRTYNVDLDPNTEINSTIGSKESIFNFPLAYIDEGDVVICPAPAYPVYAVGTRFAGGEIYTVPLLKENDFLIDLDAIPEDIVKRAKIIWTNYPNSPTGKCAPREWLEKLCQWAVDNDIIIAADEGCYNDIYFDEKPLSILEISKKNVFAIYSLSKRNNMTGYRVGFVAGDAQIVSAFKKVKTNIDSGTPNFIQDAAIAAWNDDVHVESMRQEYKAKREAMLSAFAEAGAPPADHSEATFYIWQQAPEGMTDVEFADKLLDLGIVVTPGSFISSEVEWKGQKINPGAGYIRIALVAPSDRILEAARRISQNYAKAA